MPEEPRKPAVKTYETDEIRVFWDARRCIHSGRCLNALPAVFNGEARPWVDVTGASPEEIAAAIHLCPSGALRYDGKGVPPEDPDVPTTVEARPNGPLYVRGRVTVQRAGRVLAEEYRMALCRCGGSKNKPFCDNTHKAIGFRDTD